MIADADQSRLADRLHKARDILESATQVCTEGWLDAVRKLGASRVLNVRLDPKATAWHALLLLERSGALLPANVKSVDETKLEAQAQRMTTAAANAFGLWRLHSQLAASVPSGFDGGSVDGWQLLENWVDCLMVVGEHDVAYRTLNEAEQLFGGSKAARLEALTTAVRAHAGARQGVAAEPLAAPAKPPTPEPIEVRDAASLSIKEFFTAFAAKRKPLIIRGLDLGVSHWDLATLNATCGLSPSLTGATSAGVFAWGGLRYTDGAEPTPLSDHLAAVEADPSYTGALFDAAIPVVCPRLLFDLRVPHYFAAGDLIHRIDWKSLAAASPAAPMYADKWPSLFVSTGSTRTYLHVDTAATHFWSQQIRGRKRWTIFPRGDAAKLGLTLSGHFGVDPHSPSGVNLSRWPLYSRTRPREAIVSPGDVLYVPSGSPHAVDNLDDLQIAVAANYIDAYVVKEAVKELAAEGGDDNLQLLRGLNDPQLDRSVDASLRAPVPWATFAQLYPAPLPMRGSAGGRRE